MMIMIRREIGRPLIGAALGILQLVYGFTQATAAEQQIGGVRLTVRVVPRVALGGTIYAVVTIKNELSKPLWLNSRLVAEPGLEHASVATRDMWFEIRYENAGAVRYRCSPGSVPRRFKRADYRLLLPGESIDGDEDLSCFDLTKLGHYSLIVHYLDQKDAPAAPKDATPLNYELVSAPVSFDVMGGRAN